MDIIEQRLFRDSDSPSSVENVSETMSGLNDGDPVMSSDSDPEVDSRAVPGRLHNLACVAVEAGVEVSSEMSGEAATGGGDDDSILTDGARLADEITAKLRALISENEKTKADNKKLRSKLNVLQEKYDNIVQKWVQSNNKLKDYDDMKQRCQKDHDYHAVVAPFCAWYNKNFPNCEDSVDTCQGQCARSALDVKIVKYYCHTSTCTPLLLCEECYSCHPRCVKCHAFMRGPNGWTKKRRLPPSWELGNRS
jgi:regulator of replication initiation timing